MEQTFNEAFENLTAIVGELEDDDIQLDSLADKVRHAKVLIEYCEKKLRVIENEVGKSF
jgi:exodeoxyribonuclease VII small subunit